MNTWPVSPSSSQKINDKKASTDQDPHAVLSKEELQTHYHSRLKEAGLTPQFHNEAILHENIKLLQEYSQKVNRLYSFLKLNRWEDQS